MENKELRRDFWKKENLVLFGLSRDEKSVSRQVYRLLNGKKYNIFPINPKVDKIDSIQTYKNLDEIDVNLDGAIIITNPKISIHVVKELAQKNINDVWFQLDTMDENVRNFLDENDMNYVYHCALQYNRDVGIPGNSK